MARYRKRGNKFAKAVKNVVYRMVETKLLENDFGYTNIPNTTAGINELSIIGQGSGNADRVGNQVKPTKISGQLNFININTSALTVSVRAAIVCSKVGVLTASTLSNWYESIDTDDVYVLWDKTIVLTPQFVAAGPVYSGTGAVKHFEIDIPLKTQRKIQYDDAVSTSDANGYFLMTICSANNGAQFAGFVNLYFKDV